MKRVLTFLLLLFLITASAMALADPSASGADMAKHFADKLAPPESDYSVAYLSQIFGTVGNVLQSTGGQVLGKMFDIFNKGVLVVAALWLGMTTVQIAFRAAQEGSFMGQNRSVMFTMLRIALGFSLIIPSSTTGYSLLQDIFMKIVVQSVGLADQTWDAALNYMQYGGQLYIPPNTLNSDPSIIKNYLVNSSGGSTPFVTQIFQDEVCMIASKTWEKNANEQQSASDSGSSGTAITASGTYVGYHPIYDKKKGVVYFPGYGNSSFTDPSKYSLTQASEGGHKTNAKCGYALDYYQSQLNQGKSTGSSIASAGAAASPEQQKMEQEYSYSALKQVVISLLPAAQAYVEAYNASPKYSTDQNNGLIASNGKIAFSAILAYVNLITPYQRMLGMGSALATDNSGLMHGKEIDHINDLGFIQTAKDQGWIMAGSFYWLVEETNSHLATLSVSKLVPLTGGPDSSITSVSTQAQLLNESLIDGSVYQSVTQCNGVTTANSTPGIQDSSTCIGYLWGQYVGAQQNNIQATPSGAASVSGTGSLSSDMAGGMLGNAISGVFALDGKTAFNPIAVLMRLGNTLLEVIVGVWAYAIALTVGISAGAGMCAAMSPGFLMAQTSFSWLKSIVMLITSILLFPGAILSYYVPLYPFAVFTFASVGWLLIVIEGMAAAPLVCVGVTHPDGHDFLGKSEQTLMLFLSIFIRPALMIIGLVAAMVTSFVGFHMLNSGFSSILASLSNANHTALGNDFLSPISLCMVLVIFGVMTMELIEQCFKLIYQLPSYMTKWIGAPSMGEDYGQASKQALQGAVSSGSSSMKEGLQGVGQAASEFKKGMKENEDLKNKKGGGGDVDVT